MIDYRGFNDFLKMTEGMSCLKGHMRIIEKNPDGTSGNILVDKDNLILLRTRLYVMKKLFELGEDLEAANGYINNDRRKICLFKIGNGGADINATPFQPYVPKYNDTDLVSPVGFIHVTEMKYEDSDFEANPSIKLPEEFDIMDKSDLYYRTENGKANELTNIKTYDAKAFNDGRVIFDKSNNMLYANLDLEITDSDARGEFINELGLLIAEEIYEHEDGTIITKEEYDKAINADPQVAYYYKRTWRNEELATRITFDTISLQSTTRDLMIEYRIYA